MRTTLTTFFLFILLTITSPICAQDGDNREGGIVGTGIVGTITHLGSININGQKILFDNETTVLGALQMVAADDLLPGHTVSVVAQQEGDVWRAHSIRQLLPLVGPIEQVAGDSIFVLGTEVSLGGLSLNQQAGDWVAVSGLWQRQKMIASRLDPVPTSARKARVSGTYFDIASDDTFRLGGTRVSGIQPQHLKPGDYVRVFGKPSENGIDATALENNLFDGSVGVVQVEGYFSAPRPSGLYTVLGSGLIAYTDQPDMMDTLDRVLTCGANERLGTSAIEKAFTIDISPLIARLGCGG